METKPTYSSVTFGPGPTPKSPAVYLLDPEEQVRNLNHYLIRGYTVFGVGAQPGLVTIDDDEQHHLSVGNQLITVSKSGNSHVYRFSPQIQYGLVVEALIYRSDPVREAYNILRRHRSLKIFGHPQALDAAMVETPEEAERVKAFLNEYALDRVEIYDKTRLINYPNDYA